MYSSFIYNIKKLEKNQMSNKRKTHKLIVLLC